MSDYDGETGFIEGVARELRAPVVLTPALDERVMSIVRQSPHGAGLRRLWLLRPVTIRVTPLAGMLAAAALAGIARSTGATAACTTGGLPRGAARRRWRGVARPARLASRSRADWTAAHAAA